MDEGQFHPSAAPTGKQVNTVSSYIKTTYKMDTPPHGWVPSGPTRGRWGPSASLKRPVRSRRKCEGNDLIRL